VEITVAVDGGTARLEVADDGVGFDPAGVQGLDGRHFGLTLMRQRVAMAGGTLDIQARPGHGTALVAHLPLSPSASPPKALDLGGRWGSGVPPHG
jgi:signal transduction histidine kinase